MNRQVKELNYDIDNLEHLGVIPFTLRKDSLKGEEIILWNTTLRFFNEDMKSSKKRIDYVFDNVKKVGLDDK